MAAHRYAKKVFWADREELHQEAMVAALSSKSTWDAQCGVPLSAYAWRACVLHLRNFCWRQSAPVHAPHHKLTELAGVHREEVDEEAHAINENAFDFLEEKLWVERVRAQLNHLIVQVEHEASLHARFTIGLGWGAKEVAVAFDATPKQVYAATRSVKKLCAENAHLYELMKEKRT